MSGSATPAGRNEATLRLEPPKVTAFAELAIGTTIRPSRERLRTVARLLANTASTPNPQSETGTLATHLGNMGKSSEEWKFQWKQT